MPHWEYEKKLWDNGIPYVCGIDEVGRGCFAGPVFVGCVGFPSGVIVPDCVVLEDSKKLTHNTRKISKEWIERNALFLGVGMGFVYEINSFGIMYALYKAALRAIKNAENNAGKSIQHLLVDAISIPQISSNKQTSITKGDSISCSIASASIVAKVERDTYMSNISREKQFSPYGWSTNKGYGTRKHREAILRYGITNHHRVQYVNTFLENHSKG